MGVHGGDIYRNQVTVDFSVNINPLGVPPAVEDALHRAVGACHRYPDMEAEKLRGAVSSMVKAPGEYLIFGNGASELFMAIVHGLKPKRILLPVPSFYGYEYAAKAAGAEIVTYRMQKEDGFVVGEDLLEALTGDVDLLFLANPNNPTGRLLDRGLLHRILAHCRELGIYVVLDECFIEFCAGEHSMIGELERYSHLILVRAFTKIFAIPGVRLGYLACRDGAVRIRIAEQLPEWNISGFAQEAGCACARAAQAGFLSRTQEYVKREREFLAEGLAGLGCQVFPAEANFILFYKDAPLYEALLKQGILIRDCGNFMGLGQGFYRIGVKGRKENEHLLTGIGAWKKWEP